MLPSWRRKALLFSLCPEIICLQEVPIEGLILSREEWVEISLKLVFVFFSRNLGDFFWGPCTQKKALQQDFKIRVLKFQDDFRGWKFFC